MELKLPMTIISRVDVARVLREFESLDEYMIAAAVRQTGQPMQLPRLTRQLEDLAQVNECSLLDEASRKELRGRLKPLMQEAPSLHISFASEPSAAAISKILLWFRESVHPQVLIQTGLQPNIAVGCVVRTPNLLFDLSMKQYLIQQEPYLTQLIKESARAPEAAKVGAPSTVEAPVAG